MSGTATLYHCEGTSTVICSVSIGPWEGCIYCILSSQLVFVYKKGYNIFWANQIILNSEWTAGNFIPNEKKGYNFHLTNQVRSFDENKRQHVFSDKPVKSEIKQGKLFKNFLKVLSYRIKLKIIVTSFRPFWHKSVSCHLVYHKLQRSPIMSSATIKKFRLIKS